MIEDELVQNANKVSYENGFFRGLREGEDGRTSSYGEIREPGRFPQSFCRGYFKGYEVGRHTYLKGK